MARRPPHLNDAGDVRLRSRPVAGAVSVPPSSLPTSRVRWAGMRGQRRVGPMAGPDLFSEAPAVFVADRWRAWGGRRVTGCRSTTRPSASAASWPRTCAAPEPLLVAGYSSIAELVDLIAVWQVGRTGRAVAGRAGSEPFTSQRGQLRLPRGRIHAGCPRLLAGPGDLDAAVGEGHPGPRGPGRRAGCRSARSPVTGSCTPRCTWPTMPPRWGRATSASVAWRPRSRPTPGSRSPHERRTGTTRQPQVAENYWRWAALG